MEEGRVLGRAFPVFPGDEARRSQSAFPRERGLLHNSLFRRLPVAGDASSRPSHGMHFPDCHNHKNNNSRVASHDLSPLVTTSLNRLLMPTVVTLRTALPHTSCPSCSSYSSSQLLSFGQCCPRFRVRDWWPIPPIPSFPEIDWQPIPAAALITAPCRLLVLLQRGRRVCPVGCLCREINTFELHAVTFQVQRVGGVEPGNHQVQGLHKIGQGL